MEGMKVVQNGTELKAPDEKCTTGNVHTIGPRLTL